jgi:hypothetical protein
VISILKVVGVMSCGVLLCLGLSGHAVSAVDVMNAGPAGERIGGQAGRGYEQGRREHIAAPLAGERVGGQAGREYEQGKHQHVTAPLAGERIGGQAGRGYEQGKREHANAHAGVNDMEGMGK